MSSAKGDLIERVGQAAGKVTGHAEAAAERVVPHEDRTLIKRAMDLPTTKKITLARRLWRDPRIGAAARAPLIAGLAYAVLPLKVTPKFLGPLREYEKFAGLGLLLWMLVRLAPRDVLEEQINDLERPSLWDRLRGRGSSE